MLVCAMFSFSQDLLSAQFVMKKNKSGFVFQSLVRPNLYLGSMEMSEELVFALPDHVFISFHFLIEIIL